MLTVCLAVNSQYPTIDPTDNTAQHELYAGLILQYHLDKASPMNDSSVHQPGNSQLEN